MKDIQATAERGRIDSEFVSGCAEIAAKHVSQEAVKQARAAALRWVLDEINDGVPVYGPSIVHRFAPAGHLDGVLSERERLRNLIEKELQQ